MKVRELPTVKEPLGGNQFKAVAVLQNVYNYFVNKEINGDDSYQFDMLLDDPKVEFLQYNNFIEIRGQLYTINQIDTKREVKGKKYIHVSGYHIFYRIGDFYREKDSELDNYKPNASLQEVVTEILQNTPYNMVTTDITDRNDIMLDRGNTLGNITKCLQTFGGEVIRDNFNFSVMKTFGEDNGILLRHQKNIVSMSRTVDDSEVITRLYVYGKDGLTIESVNSGKKYLDSANIGKYPFTRAREIVFNGITNPTTLLKKGREHLEKYEKPMVTYKARVVDLTKHDPTNTEKFALGDMVHVVDKELGIKIKSRIVGYKEYIRPEESHQSVVTVNDKPTTLTDMQVRNVLTSNFIEKVFNQQSGDLSTVFLDGAINTLKNHLVASGAYTTAEVLEDKGYILENTNEESVDYGALYMGPGIFAIASSKTDGKWNWRTFGTGKGFVADHIITGTLNANLVRVINLDADNIKTGTLEAIDIHGSNITGSKITAYNSDSKTRVELDPSEGKVFKISHDGEQAFAVNGGITSVKNSIYFSHGDDANSIDMSTTQNSAGIRNGQYLRLYSGSNHIEFDDPHFPNRMTIYSIGALQLWAADGMGTYNGHEIATVNNVAENVGETKIKLQIDENNNLQYSTDGVNWETLVKA